MDKLNNIIDIFENIFKDIYPEIAKNIIKTCKKTKGFVVDIGTGTAILPRRLSELGDFEILALDIKYEMVKVAKEFIEKENKKSINVVVGNVEALPIEDNTVDLVISRGSVFFWENKVKAFKEIYRVLKQGGITYIGGGFGSKKLKEKIEAKMAQRNPEWRSERDARLKRLDENTINDILNQAGIKAFDIINDESGTGFWIIVYKH